MWAEGDVGDGGWRQQSFTLIMYIFIVIDICTHCNYLRRRSLNNHVHHHHYHHYQPFNFTFNFTFSLELSTFTFIFTLTELFFYRYIHLNV